MSSNPYLVIPNAYIAGGKYPLDQKCLFSTLEEYTAFPVGYLFDGWFGTILDQYYHDHTLYPEQEAGQIFFQRGGTKVGLNACKVDGKDAYGTMNSASTGIADPATSSNIVSHINYLYTLISLQAARAWKDPVTEYLTTPPVSPLTNSRYLVGASATGAWVGHDQSIATWNGSTWTFESPSNGWSVDITSTNKIYSYSSALGYWVYTGSNSSNLTASLFDVNGTKDSFIPYAGKLADKFYNFDSATQSNFPTDGNAANYLGYDGYFAAYGLWGNTASVNKLYIHSNSNLTSTNSYLSINSNGDLVFKDSNTTSEVTLSSMLGKSAAGSVNAIQYKLDTSGNFAGYGAIDGQYGNAYFQLVGDTGIPTPSTTYQYNLVSGYKTGISAYSTNSVIGSIVSGEYTLAQNEGQYVGGIGLSSYLLVSQGKGSFTHETITNNASVGTFADYSAILGGTDNNLTSDALRSVILGGKSINGNISDTVYVPRLALCDSVTDTGQDGMLRFKNGLQYYLNSQWNDIMAGFLYTNENINQNVGGVKSGDTFVNATLKYVLDSVFTAYLLPAFTSFNIASQNSIVKVGTVIGTSQTFNWTTSNSGNVQANSISLTDYTTSVSLATGLANNGATTVTLPSQISEFTNLATHQWQIKGLNTNSAEFSSLFGVTWVIPVYSGTSTKTSLSGAEIVGLNENLKTNILGTYGLANAGSTYKYIAFYSGYNTPDFYDEDTGFAYDMQNPVITSVTINGEAYSMKVFRSTYMIDGAANITLK